MNIAEIYSHFNGLEFLLVRKPSLWAEVKRVIALVDACAPEVLTANNRTRTDVSCSPTAIFTQFGKHFRKRHWRGRNSIRLNKWPSTVRSKKSVIQIQGARREIEAAGETPVFSYNQTDFVKDRVAIEVQFGKYAFVAYDLFVKHLAFYVRDQIDVGIEILPMKALQQHMSSGPGYYEGELYNVIRNGRGVPAVPLVVVGISP